MYYVLGDGKRAWVVPEEFITHEDGYDYTIHSKCGIIEEAEERAKVVNSYFNNRGLTSVQGDENE